VFVAELWRYPVKSMRGERLQVADVLCDGISGDRLLQVRSAGKLVTARTRQNLLGLSATIGQDGMPLVDGGAWDAPDAAALVRRAARDDAAALERSSEDRFDDTPLMIATGGALDELGIDGRRLRPNIVIGGVEGLAERDWPGRTLAAGGVRIAVEKLCLRCGITTLDPDTLEMDVGVLERINARFEGRFALNCHVLEPGRIEVGDPVELEPAGP
jgi:uncharacterized protein